MWIIGGAVIIVLVLLPKILELLIGSQKPSYGESNSEDEQGSR
jgi:hypothetical protein